MSKKDQLEESFATHWRLCYPQLPQPVRQHKFHPERKWRFDFSWPTWKVAVELQGGTFSRGRHSRPLGQAADYEKQRAAVQLGWRVLPFSTKCCDDMAAVVDEVAAVLTNAQPVRS